MNLIAENDRLSLLAQLLDQLIAAAGTLPQAQVQFDTVAGLLVEGPVTAALDVGGLVRIHDHDGFDLQKVSGGVVHYTSASGAQFRVRMDRTAPRYYGAAGNGVTNDKAALDLANASDAVEIDLQGLSYRYVGTWVAAKPIWNGTVIDDAGPISYGLLTERRVATLAEAAAALTPTTEPKLASLKAVANMISAALAGNSQTVQGRLVAVSSTSGTRVAQAWTTRALQSLPTNSITGAQLANNQIILPAGRYVIHAQAQFNADPIARIRIRNMTATETIAESADFGASNQQQANATLSTEVVLSAQTTVELQYFAAVTANPGLGAFAATSPARYAVVEIIKVG